MPEPVTSFPGTMQNSLASSAEYTTFLYALTLEIVTLNNPYLTGSIISPSASWFLGLEDVLSWLLVKGKRDATIVDINVITLLRQAIGSSPGRNTRTARHESSWGNSVCGCGDIGGE
nr:hypothetical protein [Tanacetum cinerariifolium]